MSTPNWGALVAQGRAKAVGIPWSEAEAVARSLGVPADYVRRGCLTIADYEALKTEDEAHQAKTGEKPLVAMDRNELAAKARQEGVEFTDAATADVLRQELQAKPAAKSKKKK